MHSLSQEQCAQVAGGEACQYAGTETMLTNTGLAGATGGMVGYAVAGPVGAGIGSAGSAAASMVAHGLYNFYILGYDLLGGCSGYTGTC